MLVFTLIISSERYFQMLPISSHEDQGVDGHIGCHVDQVLHLQLASQEEGHAFETGINRVVNRCLN